MALETGTYISDLVSTNPTTSDNISQGDDHLRLLKSTIKATFPNISGAVTPTHTKINDLATVTGTETLTNKTLTSPTITGTSIIGAGNGSATITSAVIAGASGTGTNIAGANLDIRAGNGTGTGGSGVITFQTAAVGTTGTTANTLAERMRIDKAGNVGIGTTSPANKLHIYDATTAQANLFGDATTVFAMARASTDANGSVLQLRKARGTQASSTAVASADTVGNVNFQAYGGTNYRNVGSIGSYVETFTSDTNISGGLTFSTNSGGTGTTERMRISANGDVTVGTGADLPSLTIKGGDYPYQEIAASSNQNYGGSLQFSKSRGTSSSKLAVQTNDGLALVRFYGYSGTSSLEAAQIQAVATGTITSTAVPGALFFSTANSAGTLTTRLVIDSVGDVTVRNAGVLGYGSGSGGTVTQATSKATAVTLNKPAGQITLNAAALAANTTVGFTVNNSLVAVADTIVLSLSGSLSNAAAYQMWTYVQNGSFNIYVRNITGGSLSEAFSINFSVIKGSSA